MLESFDYQLDSLLDSNWENGGVPRQNLNGIQVIDTFW